MRKIFILLVVLFINVSMMGFTGTIDKIQPKKIESKQLNKKAKTLVYNNARYGFSFNLPESWRNYRIVSNTWEGITKDEVLGERVVQKGPMLSVRHPEWTKKNPRQDIPIMIFTIAQWDMLQNDKFHIGAAPIGPSELGRNNKYIFALPARYNFAFLTGYEEVEKILNNNPLHPIYVK